MTEVVICEPRRTPVGRYGGVYKAMSAAELGTSLVTSFLEATALPGDEVDDLILGHCYPTSEAPAIGRVIALDSGLPLEVTGMQIDRRCGSGLQAVINAVMQVANGASRLVLAGGVESMSNTTYYSNEMRWGARAGSTTFHDTLARGRTTAGGKHYPVPGGMLETAENLRREYSISREDQDRFSLQSHQRAVDAQRHGRFDDEIIPVEVSSRKDSSVVSTDEHPRADASLESLAALPAVMRKTDSESTVTAGNASGQNDGAAICIVTTPDNAERLRLQAFGRLVSWSLAGVHPARMGIGPVPSTASALERAGLTLADIDLIELNEAFAAQALACTTEWELKDADFDRLNVNGSGISLGHPVGATGGRILATLMHEMKRREVRYGLETMCIGGGQGLAAVFERVS
jgi:acetyl-CoA C-acetyltransferase